MQHLIITGANGSGKSHLAQQLGAVRPNIPIVSFDAVKLMQNWQQRPRDEIDDALWQIIAQKQWILEGGPSLLPQALLRADGVIWLDPPDYLRALRLLIRPWRNFGTTRPELPPGNADWPLQQYRFAQRSLRSGARVRATIDDALAGADDATVWRCKTQRQIDQAAQTWRAA
ncbi:DNA topology modulation protein FlaR [Actibacterium sp. 188UL27-1]|uniref:DNA topology modulation protein FlaR n=1 Tax=Actibacterium sp. 188UL27-1 TaxID=2786961 RepID=UPI00195EC119|nr:DNA topology modulation protein FlaR [Actibacterium sp. 188UL27-1]MBM7066597.1 DNA topology modulation protein FlaR [Actibacterium sp. 188UL27-1]